MLQPKRTNCESVMTVNRSRKARVKGPEPSNIPDSSLKEVKLMSIWTLTSPQPLTSSRKSSAVRSSRAFLGRTSSKPFLIA